MAKMTVTKFDGSKQDQLILLQALERFQNKRVLVVGDVGLDEYILGQVRRISPEAPVPVLDVESEDKRLGLAANVAQNISALGGDPLLLSVVGEDAGAEMLKALFKSVKVSVDHLVIDRKRPTTRKTRVMSGPHHIVRVDHELRKYISHEVEDTLIKKFETLVPQADIVVLEDYAKGVITEKVVAELTASCKRHGKKLLVDPHRDNKAEFYHGVDLIKPNYEESLALAGLKFEDLKDNPNQIVEAGLALKEKTGAKEIVLTRGKEGMTIFTKDNVVEVPTYAKKVFDVTGAGDTVIATLALGQAAGLDLVHACMLANYAAGIVVAKIGCVPCEMSELKASLL